MNNRDYPDAVVRRGMVPSRGPVSLAALVCLTLLTTATIAVGLRMSPDEYAVTSSSDLDGDALADAVDAAPSGTGSGIAEPGVVYISTGSGDVITIHGAAPGDRFGESIAVVGDVNGDGIDDMVIGAPGTQNGEGLVYLFHGPFNLERGEALTTADAVAAFRSPFLDDYEFGSRVRPVANPGCGGGIGIAMAGYFLDQDGAEKMRTFVVEADTGDSLFVIVGQDPFDPWVEVPGDVTGDGVVDGKDLELVLRNQGLAGVDR